MKQQPPLENCPQCHSENIYESAGLWICPECNHEWSAHVTTHADADSITESEMIVDAYGVKLHEGDAVTVIKDLKVKGSSLVVKVGTKVKSIRLVESSDGHNIACKIDGVGAMNLKSEFVKKI